MKIKVKYNNKLLGNIDIRVCIYTYNKKTNQDPLDHLAIIIVGLVVSGSCVINSYLPYLATVWFAPSPTPRQKAQ